jgi:hypothetical protein
VPGPTITRLRFEDELLAELPFPKRPLRILRGLGSGLTRTASGKLVAIGDRGPNLKIPLAVETYGMDVARHHAAPGAKVMPALEIGPALVELRLDGETVTIDRVVPITAGGEAVSGLPPPGSANSRVEPAVHPDGSPCPPDPGGMDTEGIAAVGEDEYWIGDEYGPSLIRIRDGEVVTRWVPEGTEAMFRGAGHPVEGCLPALAARRYVNRGFEAIGLSSDGSRLHLAFQSPLAHPDKEAFAAARHVRLWTLDASTGALLAQYLYELDPPATFLRDSAEEPLKQDDLKVSEMLCLGPGRLLLLERGSATTKFYAVELTADRALPPEHAEEATRPTIEQMSAAGTMPLPALPKRLLLSTDDHPEISRDLEGMVLLDERTLLVVNDNDFGIEDAATVFWRVRFDQPIG